MGNIRGWGGPLTKEVRYSEFLLNKKVHSIVCYSIDCRTRARAGSEAHLACLQRLCPSR